MMCIGSRSPGRPYIAGPRNRSTAIYVPRTTYVRILLLLPLLLLLILVRIIYYGCNLVFRESGRTRLSPRPHGTYYSIVRFT